MTDSEGGTGTPPHYSPYTTPVSLRSFCIYLVQIYCTKRSVVAHGEIRDMFHNVVTHRIQQMLTSYQVTVYTCILQYRLCLCASHQTFFRDKIIACSSAAPSHEPPVTLYHFNHCNYIRVSF